MDEQAEPGEIEYGPTKYVNWEPEHLCAGVVCWCGTSIETVMSDDGEEETTIVTHRSMEQIIDTAVAEQTTNLRASLAAARQAQAQAEAERDAARKREEFAKEGEANTGFLKQLWESECGYYARKSNGYGELIERQRRTVRALVVAARAMWRALRALANSRAKLQMVLLGVKVNMSLLKEQAERQQAKE